jgi:1,3-beta-glucan synthase
VRLSISQQLDEICLFLLIWGEAANLRFMPELLHTIFELARTHVPETKGGAPPSSAVSGSFLHRVVQPIYKTIVKAGTAKARTGHSYDTENYDDWNEAFWRRQRGLSELCTAEGVGIFAQPPQDRWACLLRADWERFLLSKTRKTHRELRWWSCLLAANRRIFLLHFVTFVGVAAWTMPSIQASTGGRGWSGVSYGPRWGRRTVWQRAEGG